MSHWYAWRDGEAVAVYEHPETGRRIGLRAARELGLCPGTTSILSLEAAPGLERWKLHRALEVAATTDRHPQEPVHTWAGRIARLSRDSGPDYAAIGTAIHDQTELLARSNGDADASVGAREAYTEALRRLGGPSIGWRLETPFCASLGFGGRVDISTPDWIVDLKTTDLSEDPNKRLAWDNHRDQLAAYWLALREDGLVTDDCRLANCFVCRETGAVRWYEWSRQDRDDGAQAFLALLQLWKNRKRYDPQFEKEITLATTVRESESTYSTAPEGLHLTVCCDVIDHGPLESPWGIKEYVTLVWQSEQRDEEGRRYTIRERCTKTLGTESKPSTLRRLLESWRGRRFTAEEANGFDLDALLGCAAQVQVIHQETRKGGVWPKAASVVRAPQGTKLEVEDYVMDRDRVVEQTTEDDDIPF